MPRGQAVSLPQKFWGQEGNKEGGLFPRCGHAERWRRRVPFDGRRRREVSTASGGRRQGDKTPSGQRLAGELVSQLTGWPVSPWHVLRDQRKRLPPGGPFLPASPRWGDGRGGNNHEPPRNRGPALIPFAGLVPPDAWGPIRAKTNHGRSEATTMRAE